MQNTLILLERLLFFFSILFFCYDKISIKKNEINFYFLNENKYFFKNFDISTSSFELTVC